LLQYLVFAGEFAAAENEYIQLHPSHTKRQNASMLLGTNYCIHLIEHEFILQTQPSVFDQGEYERFAFQRQSARFG
jgi:hypothetical protein